MLVNNQGVLDILLDNPVAPFALSDVLQNLVVVAQHRDTSSSALMAWLHDPEVLVSV